MAAVNITKILEEVDKDKDGLVSADEVKQVCIKLNLDITMVPAIVRAYDANNDGLITLKEFETFYQEHNSTDKEVLFRRLFQKIDKDNSGFVDVHEMMDFTALIGEPTTRDEAQEQLEGIDANADGKVSYKELWEVFKEYL